MPASPNAAETSQIVVLFADPHRLRFWHDVLTAARAAGLRIESAYLGNRAKYQETSRDLALHHRLDPSRTRSRWRRPLLSAAAVVGPSSVRLSLAGRFDPWLRDAVRQATDVVLDDTSSRLYEVVTHFNPDLQVHSGPHGMVGVLQEQVPRVVLHHLEAAHDQTSYEGAATHLHLALDLLSSLGRAGVPLSNELVGPVAALLASPLGPVHRDRILPGLAEAEIIPLAVLDAYASRYDLDASGRSDDSPGRVAGAVLETIDQGTGCDQETELEWICLALEVGFHRELHSDSIDSPLLSDPADYLGPLRATRTWARLTGPIPQQEHRTAARDSREQPPWRPDASHRIQVLMLPGPYGTFQAPLEQALRGVTGAAVHTVRRQELPGHLRTMGITRKIVRLRLAAERGRPVEDYPRLTEALNGEPLDAVVIDWADKTAVLASMLTPPTTRFILRLHGVDLLRPWIHLLDWSRVDALVCVSQPLLELARELLGSRLDHVECHVVPNLLALTALESRAEAPRDSRTLCVVGWAQRVKDPLWALEVLAQLRRSGEDWRLMLVGADFPATATASGRDYADRFRRRAMEDDVREHIDYNGFVRDLPPVLSQAAFVLSTSLREGWPVGLAEAVAAGAVPVVRQWPMLASRGGARAVWPADWVVDDVPAAVDRIRRYAAPETRLRAARAARVALHERADPSQIAGSLLEIVLGTVGRLGHLLASGRFDEARALARQVRDQAQVTPPLLLQAAVSAGQLGEPSLRQDLLKRWSQLYPHPYVTFHLRRQAGLLKELSPGWRPRLSIGPGPAQSSTPARPKVLHLIKVSLPYRQSGYAMRTFHLLSEQARAGHDVVAVTPLDFPEVEDGVEVPAEDVIGGVRYRRIRRPLIPDHEHADDYLQAFASAFEDVVEQERPSVIHVHSGHRGYDLAIVALAVAEAAGIPVVYEVRGFFEAVWTSAPGWAEEAEMYRLRRRIEADCLHRAAVAITLSESMRADILSRQLTDPPRPAIQPEDVFVVPNGVNPDPVTDPALLTELRDDLALNDTFVFGYISNMDHPREGHELLIDAVKILRHRGRNVTAVLVGDGHRMGHLRDYAVRSGVADHVRFTGQVPHADISAYYALLDVFVVPRIDERAARLVTPLKPYEAMAMGLPIVVSDLEALQEIIGEGRRGVAFPPGDARALADVLEALADSPERRAALGAEARRWVRQYRTWAAVARTYSQAYDRALGTS